MIYLLLRLEVMIYCQKMYLHVSTVSGEFSTYLRHVRSLDFTDKPDYGYLRDLFLAVLHKHSWDCDWQFDWIIQHKV